MHMTRQIMVRVLKHDRAEYRRWNARIRRREGPLLVLEAEFEVDVSHHLLGSIQQGTRTVEYYWLDRWYNVFRFLRDDGKTRLWYCNVNTPPAFAGDTLTYIDLDIDVLVQPDLSYQVLDLDEFEMNSRIYNYSTEEQKNAHAAVAQLTSLIDGRQFPFLLEDSSLSSVVDG
jgi:protein associated with RNAse G/E